jgi:hypothetical protein
LAAVRRAPVRITGVGKRQRAPVRAPEVVELQLSALLWRARAQ